MPSGEETSSLNVVIAVVLSEGGCDRIAQPVMVCLTVNLLDKYGTQNYFDRQVIVGARRTDSVPLCVLQPRTWRFSRRGVSPCPDPFDRYIISRIQGFVPPSLPLREFAMRPRGDANLLGEFVVFDFGFSDRST